RSAGESVENMLGEPYVEPAHDALVRGWDKLLRWKREAQEGLALQRRLAQHVLNRFSRRPINKLINRCI
ncbi:MAG: hypothetical protein AAFV46_12330, partial [Cyanobacteria bacterium J06635_11]